MIGPQWLESISEVNGLDPLGVQAISIRIYGYLLPGISNVTNRLRYYSFLCWVLYNYTKEIGSSDLDKWRMYLRKAEFLFSLISDAHHINDLNYNSSLVGSDTSTPLIRKHNFDSFDLNKYTQFEYSPDRYFKNKGGGFAQAYKGPMEDLMLVVSGGPLRVKLADDIVTNKVTRYGKKAALAFSKNNNLKLFHDCIVNGIVSKDDLDKMSNLCACQILNNPDEYFILLHLLFNDKYMLGDQGERRRKTLFLILKFMMESKISALSIDDFRNICMFGHYLDSRSIHIPDQYNNILSIWGIYQIHEYFSFALLSLLYVFEKVIDSNAGSFDEITSFIKEDVLERNKSYPHNSPYSKVKFDADMSLNNFITIIDSLTENESTWFSNTTSEYYIENAIIYLIKKSNTLSDVFCLAYILLAKIHLRTRNLVNNYNYGEKINERIYASNINRLNYEIGKLISKESRLWDFISRVLKTFVIDRHTIVALRKFRYEKKSTLRYSMDDRSYVRTNKLKFDYPVFTNPRLQQAFRFLEDLGMLQRVNNKKYTITQVGIDYIENLHEL